MASEDMWLYINDQKRTGYITATVVFNTREVQYLRGQSDNPNELHDWLKEQLKEKIVSNLIPPGSAVVPERPPHQSTLTRYTSNVRQAIRGCIERENRRLFRTTVSEKELEVLALRAGVAYKDLGGDSDPRSIRTVADLLDKSRGYVHELELAALKRAGLLK